MKHLVLLIIFFFVSGHGFTQLFNTNAVASGPTNYSTVSYTDSIYYYCGTGNNGALTALPASGIGNWTFTWQRFDATNNAWVAYSVTNNATSSTISNLAPGGYRVTITDAVSTIVGCYRAWIVNVLSPTTVNVDPIPSGCGAVPLHGNINWGTATPYYEPPPEPLLIGPTTTITVCFSANHTYVSDLGFYLVAPASCGNTTIALSPNPGSIGQNNICNSGNDVNMLCFTTSAFPNLNVCTASTPLTGTYDSYGPSSTPINWTGLYGCNAAQPGWAVQIYDCIAADVGSLTYASVTFTGTSACGDPVSFTYDSGNINSAINDNSCSAGTASIYLVPVNPSVVVPYDQNYIWTAVPNINIPNNTTSLDPIVNPGPNQNTTFTLSIDTTGGAACIPAVCGGNSQDSELYIYTPPTPAALSGPATICTGDAPVALTTSVPGGYWTGNGVNPGTGVFDPGASGVVIGGNTIMYTVSNPCPINSFITINVVNGTSTAVIATPPNQCATGAPIILTATPSGGTWSGTGITNAATGEFSPTATPGPGQYTISYATTGGCPASGTVTVTIDPIPDASFTFENNVCENSPAYLLVPVTSGGTWSGPGVNSTSGLFDPSVSGDGSFVISYCVGACNTCSQETIVVNPLPVVNASANQGICNGDSVQIFASGAVDYVWSPSTGLSSTTIADPYASPLSPITYLVTGTDANGCSDTADVMISIFTPANVTISGGTQVCSGDSLFLTANNMVSNISWTPSGTVSDPNDASTFVFPSSDETYFVTGDDANGCAVSASVNIIVNSVDAVIGANPDSGMVPLTVDFTNSSSGAIMYIWNYGNGIIDTTYTLTSTQTVFETEGTYNVTMTAISAAGCMDITSITIYVFPECVVSVPNIFSPNGDNLNDLLNVICSQTLKSMNMQIFDRWGKKVIELTDPNQTWNGNGSSEGTYYYILTAEGFNETFYKLSGHITLSR
jgi:gliding motility-associated-like protein